MIVLYKDNVSVKRSLSKKSSTEASLANCRDDEMKSYIELDYKFGYPHNQYHEDSSIEVSFFDIEKQHNGASEDVDPSVDAVRITVERSSSESTLSSSGTVRVEGEEPEDLGPIRRSSMRIIQDLDKPFGMRNSEDLDGPEIGQKNVDDIDIFTITSVAGYIKFIDTGRSSREEVIDNNHGLLVSSTAKKLRDKDIEGDRESRAQIGIYIHLFHKCLYVYYIYEYLCIHLNRYTNIYFIIMK
jgi:hypothetical protein